MRLFAGLPRCRGGQFRPLHLRSDARVRPAGAGHFPGQCGQFSNQVRGFPNAGPCCRHWRGKFPKECGHSGGPRHRLPNRPAPCANRRQNAGGDSPNPWNRCHEFRDGCENPGEHRQNPRDRCQDPGDRRHNHFCRWDYCGREPDNPPVKTINRKEISKDMSKAYYIPSKDADKRSWLNNFAAKLPNYAATVGVAAAELSKPAVACHILSQRR